MGGICSTVDILNEKIKKSKCNCSCRSSCMDGDDEMMVEIKELKKFRKSLSILDLKKIKEYIDNENKIKKIEDYLISSSSSIGDETMI